MYEDYKILLDCDGVLLDSETRIWKLRKEKSNLSWDDFFQIVDWEKLYQEAEEIENSLHIVRKLQKKGHNLAILTKTHMIREGISKVKRLREEDITVPIIMVPPDIKKSEIYIPDKKSLLVDDNLKMVKDWREKGGEAILFDINNSSDEKQKVKSLKFLL